ncbi:hypothetical protein CANCADRAFT_138898 [Tortispora caseinolytica NRRL Y-17796]|uniref:Uncharacterized protein n=1 Tax=Tortispora caseinolytica NRRL Y-17796 TaxID=767744 RepID=A0A1E4TC73_9ASCO|nr:hypothetical protein CANCADRAFT_138898 [Tortispora caseinolytica NRRL Y-17796]
MLGTMRMKCCAHIVGIQQNSVVDFVSKLPQVNVRRQQQQQQQQQQRSDSYQLQMNLIRCSSHAHKRVCLIDVLIGMLLGNTRMANRGLYLQLPIHFAAESLKLLTIIFWGLAKT